MAVTVLNEDLSVADGSYDEAKGGIESPQPRVLRPGAMLYRFAGSVDQRNGARPGGDQQAGSPWWMEEAAFLRLADAMRRDPTEWTLIARSSLAVKFEWSTMDALYEAEVLQPIAVWAGAAALQVARTPGGGVVTMPGSRFLEHVFIPNITASLPTLFVRGVPALRARREAAPHAARTGEFDRLIRTIMKRTGATVVLPDPTVLH